jgi:SAM-dependent methyltransferase
LTDHWFEEVADHLGAAYLRYSFTKGTVQEVAFLRDVLELDEGSIVLDVGCGPGRHARALAGSGVLVHGVDISTRFVELAASDAPAGATFERLDARALPFEARFDAAYSVCQGAFGILGGPGADDDPLAGDLAVLRGMARAVRAGGLVALTAFSAAFGLTHLGPDDWDPVTGVHHEHTRVIDEDGRSKDVELWTTWFTARELHLLAGAAGLEPLAVWGGEPGGYGRRSPTAAHAELFLLARVPTGTERG